MGNKKHSGDGCPSGLRQETGLAEAPNRSATEENTSGDGAGRMGASNLLARTGLRGAVTWLKFNHMERFNAKRTDSPGKPLFNTPPQKGGSLGCRTDSTRVSSNPSSYPPSAVAATTGEPCAPDPAEGDIVFSNNMHVKLHRKLSAKCRCQFEVFEAEAVRGPLHPFPNSPCRFALKILDVSSCPRSKLSYKWQSLTQESRVLKYIWDQLQALFSSTAAKQLCKSMHCMARAANQLASPPSSVCPVSGPPPVRGRSEQAPRARLTPPLWPIPQFFWISEGKRSHDGADVLAVAMEVLEGCSLTQFIQQQRHPMRGSSALLSMEVAVRMAESQRVLATCLSNPIVNWDTKPGNIVVELERSVTGRICCRRAVIVDLGDALPTDPFWFPTRHLPGESPAYIICTKGYCSPECAILVFLLASNPRCTDFRRIWYGTDAELDSMQAARQQRATHLWRNWIADGYLRARTDLPPGGANPRWGCAGSWEVRFTQASVIFSTGLVLAQLFGGPSILHLVHKDDPRAVDALCEWDCHLNPNFLTQKPNLGPDDLLPRSGLFAAEPWRSSVATVLHGCLAFNPSRRWTFRQLEAYLSRMHRSLERAYYLARQDEDRLHAARPRT